ncbi:hypothetical protein VTK73DRAFT_7409 [Phialemonium thermophilum]|uniref:ASX DEUBAD domain-containing protein n=1 Tax=Phialemonium thermophilum TaxID=223376 RepID=A0ABR3XSW5_9PEZI
MARLVEDTFPLSSPPDGLFDTEEGSLPAQAQGDGGHSKSASTSQDQEADPLALPQDSEDLESVSSTVRRDIEEGIGKQNDEITSSFSTASKSSVPARGTKRKIPMARKRKITSRKKPKGTPKRWTAPFVFSDPKTPLLGLNLREILLNPSSWDCLSQESQDRLLSLLPDKTHVFKPDDGRPRPNVVSLRNDDTFRHDSARYCESIASGYHDEDYLREAWIAHHARDEGLLDDYLVSKFESEWEIELPQEIYPKSLRCAADVSLSKTMEQDTGGGPPQNESQNGSIEKEVNSATEPEMVGKPTTESPVKIHTSIARDGEEGAS